MIYVPNMYLINVVIHHHLNMCHLNPLLKFKPQFLLFCHFYFRLQPDVHHPRWSHHHQHQRDTCHT